MIIQRQVRMCDVHYLVDGDSSPRPTKYCPDCDAWICDECWGNYPKRAMAMVKRGAMKVSDFFGGIFQ